MTDIETVRHIRMGGELIACDAPVVLWDMPGGLPVTLWKGSRKRRHDIDMMVLHWTGGEGSAERVSRVLAKRSLGVEFIIDRDGVIFQCCDPLEVDTFDAGKYNPRSVGVEIVNFGFRRTPDETRRMAERFGRDTYTTPFRGRKRRTFATFHKSQLESADQLCRAVCEALPNLPRKLPRTESGAILRDTFEPKEARAYSGIVGHFHISRRKSDPGLDLLQHLDSTGDYR